MSNQLFLLFDCVCVVMYIQLVGQIESDMTHGTYHVNTKQCSYAALQRLAHRRWTTKHGVLRLDTKNSKWLPF